ncbi:MAG: hypothetical protein SFY80_00090 [Verrucomicrobiota bacterium]|nr:hypothetical protein [Verrucomicrobiota bacterium]
MKNAKLALGIHTLGEHSSPPSDSFLIEYANLKLAALGQPLYHGAGEFAFMDLATPLVQSLRAKSALLDNYLCPVDQRIQDFVCRYLAQLPEPERTMRLPASSFVLDRHGLARTVSLPPNKDEFSSSILRSVRLHQGVLHNPAKDRRTTQGVFHICEGGLPIPADKLAVPQLTFARLLQRALAAPADLLELPFTAGQEEKAYSWVSLLLRPRVVPAIPGKSQTMTYECRFFAPGSLVANLDFVESIFGNAGDPGMPENDAALDVAGWTGHTGCVILAPHLIQCTMKALGLPHRSEATERQKRDGMCWDKETDLYNNGSAFKVTARDASGVIITLIADNYFGYCKKEVKTQISYCANLFGQAEEEHAGGAIAYPSYDLGEDFRLAGYMPEVSHTFAELLQTLADRITLMPEGYAVDKQHSNILYVPEDASFNLTEQLITWNSDGPHSLRLKPRITYVLPSGYKVEMQRPHESRRWRLIGTTAEGVNCHKPCTVSGGGKSEISKSITDAVIYGPVIVADFQRDFDQVESIINKEYGMRFRDATKNRPQGRPILSTKRSLGSVIKLLTPSSEYTDEYNEWLRSIPYYIKEVVFVVKRFYKADWGTNWRERFIVDRVNGVGGNELKYRSTKLITQYLRVGYENDGSWRTFGLRKDFAPAVKLQTEDDISASMVVPVQGLSSLGPQTRGQCVKFLENCEYRLFQRPDDAIHRGYDKRTESDFSHPGNFLSNYEPITREQVRELTDDVIRYDQYTQPIKKLVHEFLQSNTSRFLGLPSHPRLVDGKPSKNPRYLQDRDDLVRPRAFYLGEIGARLYRRIPTNQAVPQPVTSVLPGRRNNPPEDGVRPLAVYNPIHYLPLPEFFLEVISSITGKSPSTTGAGSEGALTKGPFNAVSPIVDLNNTLVSMLLTGAQAFVTAAGYVGPHYRVDHDISLLVPEIWCRLKPEERDANFLIRERMLEPCPDIEYQGKTIPSSILGYRITARFAQHFFGRVFANPAAVLTDEMLRPEIQDLAVFADGMDNILSTHRRVAELYFEDGSVEQACPPLKALLHIMAKGNYNGHTIQSPEVRALFDRDAMLASDWYAARLKARQQVEHNLWTNHLSYLRTYIGNTRYANYVKTMQLDARVKEAQEKLEIIDNPDYHKSLLGTLGTDPSMMA